MSLLSDMSVYFAAIHESRCHCMHWSAELCTHAKISTHSLLHKLWDMSPHHHINMVSVLEEDRHVQNTRVLYEWVVETIKEIDLLSSMGSTF